MNSLLLPRAAVALVWMYQGFWCKLLGRAPRQLKIMDAAPFIGSVRSRQALAALGILECVLAAWVLSGARAREAAVTQTLLVAGMNTAGLFWARGPHFRSGRHAASEFRFSTTRLDRCRRG